MNDQFELPETIEIKIHNKDGAGKSITTTPKLDGLLKEAFAEGANIVNICRYNILFDDVKHSDNDYFKYSKRKDVISVQPQTDEARAFSVRLLIYEKVTE